MKIKHILASKKDKKPTILSTEINKCVKNCNSIIVAYENNEKNYFIMYHKSRNGESWYADQQLPKCFKMPEIGKPELLNVKGIMVQNELF